MHNVLLTGVPGVGKTTVIERILPLLPEQAGGFITREMRIRGGRVGFRVVDLAGNEGTLAHVDGTSPFTVGRYHVDVGAFERVGVAALERALKESHLIVIDEIGSMELCSPRFRQAVMECLDAPQNVLGVIQMKPMPFLEAIRSRRDVFSVTVTRANRDTIPADIAGMFQSSYRKES